MDFGIPTSTWGLIFQLSALSLAQLRLLYFLLCYFIVTKSLTILNNHEAIKVLSLNLISPYLTICAYLVSEDSQYVNSLLKSTKQNKQKKEKRGGEEEFGSGRRAAV